MSFSNAPQALAVGAFGVALIAVIVMLTRRGALSLRFGLGWLVVAVIVAASSVFLGVVAPVARFLHTTPTGLLLVGMSGFLLLLALNLSVSVSALQDAVRDLSESNALLEERLQEVERQS
jgi:uncharacterized protein DUF2304